MKTLFNQHKLTCPDADCEGMPLNECLKGKNALSLICLNCMEEFYLKGDKLYDKSGNVVKEGIS